MSSLNAGFDLIEGLCRGSSRLREIFLKTDNFLGGRYLAELTKGELVMAGASVVTDTQACLFLRGHH